LPCLIDAYNFGQIFICQLSGLQPQLPFCKLSDIAIEKSHIPANKWLFFADSIYVDRTATTATKANTPSCSKH